MSQSVIAKDREVGANIPISAFTNRKNNRFQSWKVGLNLKNIIQGLESLIMCLKSLDFVGKVIELKVERCHTLLKRSRFLQILKFEFYTIIQIF